MTLIKSLNLRDLKGPIFVSSYNNNHLLLWLHCHNYVIVITDVNRHPLSDYYGFSY